MPLWEQSQVAQSSAPQTIVGNFLQLPAATKAAPSSKTDGVSTLGMAQLSAFFIVDGGTSADIRLYGYNAQLDAWMPVAVAKTVLAGVMQADSFLNWPYDRADVSVANLSGTPTAVRVSLRGWNGGGSS